MAISAARRQRVWERDHWACHYCGKTPPLSNRSVDHVWPVARGGVDEDWNLVPACAYPCNETLGDRVDKCGCEFCVHAAQQHRDGLVEPAATRAQLRRRRPQPAPVGTVAAYAGWIRDPATGVWSRASGSDSWTAASVRTPSDGVLVGMTEQNQESNPSEEGTTEVSVETPATEETSVEVETGTELADAPAPDDGDGSSDDE